MKFLCFLPIILTVFSSLAVVHASELASDLIATDSCTRLSDVTCTAGTLDDGTGISWSGSDAELKKTETERLTAIARPFFQKKLATDTQFRAQMISNAQMGGSVDDLKLLDFTVSQAVTAMTRKRFGLATAFSGLLKGSKIGNALFKRTYDEDRLYSDFFTFVGSEVIEQSLARQIESDFKSVRLELMSVIRDQVPAGKSRDKMVDQVNSVQFEGIDCSALGGLSMASRWDNLLVPNAFYSPLTNKFTYCNGLGHYNSSLFQRYFVIAHELSHSVDPCSFERDGRKFPAPEIVSCLRDNESVGAMKQNKFTPSKLDPKIAALGEPLTDCAAGDQIGESFADFMAAEVLSHLVLKMKPLTVEQKRTGVANTLRFPGGCKERKEYDVHPQLRVRIDRILFANPSIQDEMECRQVPAVKLPRYCGKR